MDEPEPVQGGDHLGHFRYGGSLFMMIFEPGRFRFGAVSMFPSSMRVTLVFSRAEMDWVADSMALRREP